VRKPRQEPLTCWPVRHAVASARNRSSLLLLGKLLRTRREGAWVGGFVTHLRAVATHDASPWPGRVGFAKIEKLKLRASGLRFSNTTEEGGWRGGLGGCG